MDHDGSFETEFDALLDGDPTDFIEDRCKQSLLSVASDRGLVARTDIYNRRGVLLARRGQGLDARRRALLLNHQIKGRFLDCVGLENEIELNAVPEAVTVLAKAWLAGAAEGFSPTITAMNEMLGAINFSTAVRTAMTVLAERHPGTYDAGFLCAIFAVRMTREMGYLQGTIVEAFTTALFHHLGYSNLAESERDSPFTTLHPDARQQQAIRVHPLWTYRLLQSINEIDQDEPDVFHFSPASLQGVLLHHRGIDGVSGYGGQGMPNETARLLYVIDTFIALAQTGMSTADALRLMARHAGQGTDESTGEATRFSTGRGYRRTGALFDARLVSRLESVVTAELAIPVNPGLRHAERLPADYLDTLFATLNRVARELGELRIRLAKYARDPSVTAVEQAVVKDVLVECATMLKSILSESQLFSRNEDQLHGFARSGRIGALITNVHPVFRQLAGGITVIETTITQLLVHREGEGSDHVLAELHRAAVDLAKVIHDAYREYLDATRTRALEAAA